MILRYNRLLLFLCLLLIPNFGVARSIPPLTAPVVDEGDLLSSSEEANLNHRIQSFYERTGKQLQVVTVISLEGETLEDFSIRLAEAWKIGKKESGSGVILLVSKQDRAIRIEVGEGLEGDLTDAHSKRIIDKMVSYFRESHFEEGIEVGVLLIMKELLGEKSDLDKNNSRTYGISDSIFFMSVLLFLLMGFVGFFTKKRRRGFGGNDFWGSGGFFGGGSWGGGSLGGGWSGGGGGFSGGGASGRW